MGISGKNFFLVQPLPGLQGQTLKTLKLNISLRDREKVLPRSFYRKFPIMGF